MVNVNKTALKRAIARSFELARETGRRCKVRRLDADNIIEVLCLNNHRHAVAFSRDSRGRLTAECYLPDTDEPCPSEQGHRACHHIPEALALYLAITEKRIGRTVAPSRRAQVPAAHAIKRKVVDGKVQEKVRGIRI